MTELPDNFQTAPLGEVDPEIAEVLDRELGRQQGTLEMSPRRTSCRRRCSKRPDRC
jgi:hypothetical protein